MRVSIFHSGVRYCFTSIRKLALYENGTVKVRVGKKLYFVSQAFYLSDDVMI